MMMGIDNMVVNLVVNWIQPLILFLALHDFNNLNLKSHRPFHESHGTEIKTRM